MSMKPGATTWPSASRTCPPSSPSPIAAITPSRSSTSARRPGEPVPSTTVPPLMTMLLTLTSLVPPPATTIPPVGTWGRVRAGRSGEQQVDVSELVPEVSLGQAGPVGRLEHVAAGDGLEHHEVRRLGLVPAGQQTVDQTYATFGRDDQIGPPVDRPRGTVGTDRRLEGAHHGGAHRHHPPPG